MLVWNDGIIQCTFINSRWPYVDTRIKGKNWAVFLVISFIEFKSLLITKMDKPTNTVRLQGDRSSEQKRLLSTSFGSSTKDRILRAHRILTEIVLIEKNDNGFHIKLNVAIFLVFPSQ